MLPREFGIFLGVITGLVNIVFSTAPVFGLQFPRLTADSSCHVQVTFYGVPGSTFIIQRSSDLNSWADISTNTATTGNPVLTVTDVVSPNGQADCRLEWQPRDNYGARFDFEKFTETGR